MRKFLLWLILTSGIVAGASGGTIVGATGAIINSGGNNFGSISDTFNQSGLLSGYISGSTDFDAYLAGDPLHTQAFAGFEWFSTHGSSSASVTYDLGAVTTIDALALWDEDSAGIGRLALFQSSDGVSFSLLVDGLMPTNNPITLDYGADVFSFQATALRYIRFDMSECPQADVGNFFSCAIGEVAFEAVAPTGNVPEPGSIALLGLGLAGLLWWPRRAGLIRWR